MWIFMDPVRVMITCCPAKNTVFFFLFDHYKQGLIVCLKWAYLYLSIAYIALGSVGVLCYNICSSSLAFSVINSQFFVVLQFSDPTSSFFFGSCYQLIMYTIIDDRSPVVSFQVGVRKGP